MPIQRLSTLHGQRPGSNDVPPEHLPRAVTAARDVKEEEHARTARRHNPAYGTLNLDDWTEGHAKSPRLFPGGPRKPRSRSPR